MDAKKHLKGIWRKSTETLKNVRSQPFRRKPSSDDRLSETLSISGSDFSLRTVEDVDDQFANSLVRQVRFRFYERFSLQTIETKFELNDIQLLTTSDALVNRILAAEHCDVEKTCLWLAHLLAWRKQFGIYELSLDEFDQSILDLRPLEFVHGEHQDILVCSVAKLLKITDAIGVVKANRLLVYHFENHFQGGAARNITLVVHFARVPSKVWNKLSYKHLLNELLCGCVYFRYPHYCDKVIFLDWETGTENRAIYPKVSRDWPNEVKAKVTFVDHEDVSKTAPEKNASPEELCLQSVLFLLSEPPPSSFATQEKTSDDTAQLDNEGQHGNIPSSRFPGVSFSNETETSGTADSEITPSIISLPSGMSTVPPSRSITSRSETDREHSEDLRASTSVQGRSLTSRLQDRKDSSSEPIPIRDTDISLEEREALSEPGKLPGQSSNGKPGQNTSPKKSLPRLREKKSNDLSDSRSALKSSREISKSKVSIASSAGFSLQVISQGALPIGEFTDITDKDIRPLLSHTSLGDGVLNKSILKREANSKEERHENGSYEVDSEFSSTEVRPPSVRDRVSVMTNHSSATFTRNAPSPTGSSRSSLVSSSTKQNEQRLKKKEAIDKMGSGTSLQRKPSPPEMLFTVAPSAEGIVQHGQTSQAQSQSSSEKLPRELNSQQKNPKEDLSQTDKDSRLNMEHRPQSRDTSLRNRQNDAGFQRPATAPDAAADNTRPSSSFRSVQSDNARNGSRDLPRQGMIHVAAYSETKNGRSYEESSYGGRSDDDDFYHQDLNSRPVPQLIHDVPPEFSDNNGSASERGSYSAKNLSGSNAYGGVGPCPNPSASRIISATSRGSTNKLHRTPELSSYAADHQQKRNEGGQPRFNTPPLDSRRSSVSSLPRSTSSSSNQQVSPSPVPLVERPGSEQNYRGNDQGKLYTSPDPVYRDPRMPPINESYSAEAFNNDSAMSLATVSSSHLQNQYHFPTRPPPARSNTNSPSPSYYPIQAPKQYQEYPHHAFPNNYYKHQDSHHRHQEQGKHDAYLPEHEAMLAPGFESEYERQVRYAQASHNRHSPRVHYFETQAAYPVNYQRNQMPSGNTLQRSAWEGSSVDLPPNNDYPVPHNYRDNFSYQPTSNYPVEGPQTSRASFPNRKPSGTSVEINNDGASTELERRRSVAFQPEVVYLPPPPKETKDAMTSTPRTRPRSKTNLSVEESSVTSGDIFKARSISRASKISDSVKSAVATVFLPIQRSVSDHFLTSDKAVRSVVEKTYRRGVRVAKFFSNLESPLIRAREALKVLLTTVFNFLLRHKWIPLLIAAYFLRPTVESATPSVISYLNSWRGAMRNTALPPVVPSSPSDPVPFSPRDLFSHWVMGGKFRNDLQTRPRVATPVVEPHTVPPAAHAPYKAPPDPSMTIDSVACVDSSGPREILSEWAMGSLLRSGSKKLCADAVRVSQAQRARLQDTRPSSECSAFDPVCIWNSLISSRLNPFQTVA